MTGRAGGRRPSASRPSSAAASRASGSATGSSAGRTELRLAGWVANELDGSVRCVAEGPAAGLDALEDLPPARPDRRDRRRRSTSSGCPRPGGSPGSRSAPAVIAATDGRRRPVPERTAGRSGQDVRPRSSGPSASHSGRRDRRSLTVMESQPSVPASPAPAESTASVAEELPDLYRAILERVAVLERLGARSEAGRIRVEATRAYSNAWDDAARRDLLALLARADRSAGDAGPDPGAGRSAAGPPPPADPRRLPPARRRRYAVCVALDPARDARPAGLTIAAVLDAARPAYDRLLERGGGGRGRVVVRQRPGGRVADALRRGRRRPAAATRRARSSLAAVDALDRESGAIDDPHRAIDWLSTFPQLLLVALGERP